MSHLMSSHDQSTVEQIVRDALASSGTPGAIVGLWLGERGELVQTYGIGNRETGAAPSVDDHMRIASITKTFVGTVLLQLVDEGKIALDTALSTFDFDFPKSANATLANLLGMTAGIYDYTHDEALTAVALLLAIFRDKPSPFCIMDEVDAALGILAARGVHSWVIGEIQASEGPGEAWEPNFTVPADRNNSLLLMGYAAELAHFAEVARGAAAPLATLTDARRALELIDQIYIAGGGMLDPGKTAGAW
mgnify:CR=1 FL=1